MGKRGRPIDPNTQYRVGVHKVGKYTYACTPHTVLDEKTMQARRTYVHLGKLDAGKRFRPNATFLYLPLEERHKLIFPEDWDLSEVDALPSERKAGRPPCLEDSCRFYGDIWLLEQLADKTGVTQDLEVAFEGNKEIVRDILSLSMFSYLTDKPFSHMANWQRLGRFPSTHTLEPGVITQLCQSITEPQRQTFFQQRAKRADKCELAAVDSTTRRAYGTCLAEIVWGKNKDDGLKVPQTLEVVVYSLTRHEPLYYLSFAGNMADSCTLPMILTSLRHAGFRDLIAITDRGYACPRSLDYCIAKGQRLITAATVHQRKVLDRIDAMGVFGGDPPGMRWIPEKKLYAAQYPIEKTVTGRGGTRIPSKDMRLNLYFDPALRGYALVRLEDEVEVERCRLHELQASGAVIEDKQMAAFHYHKLIRNPESHHIESYERDSNKLKRAQRTFGFFAIITHNLPYSPEEALNNYGIRDEQEKYFMRKKSQEHADLQRCSSDLSRDGRRFIEFVGMILVSRLSYEWSSSDVLRKNFRYVFGIIEEMRSIRCIEHKGRQKMMTPFIGKQALICEALGLDIPKGCEPHYQEPKATSTGKRRGRPRKGQSDTGKKS